MPLVDFEKEKFGAGYGTFCRETLTKTYMFKGRSGGFAIISKVLEPDTLDVTRVYSYWREESLRRMIGLYITKYSPSGVIKI